MNSERFGVAPDIDRLCWLAVIAISVDEELAGTDPYDKVLGSRAEAQDLILAWQLNRGLRLVLVVSEDVNTMLLSVFGLVLDGDLKIRGHLDADHLSVFVARQVIRGGAAFDEKCGLGVRIFLRGKLDFLFRNLLLLHLLDHQLLTAYSFDDGFLVLDASSQHFR